MNNETLFQKSLRLNPRAYRQKSNKQKPINLDIYEESIKNYPNIQHRQRHLNHMFRKIMRRMRRYVVCQELDIKKNAMTYVFEHIRDALIDIIATFIPKKNRDYLSEKKWNDIQWRKQLLDILIVLEYRPIILWFFLHTNYFHLEDFENQRIRIQENIELLKQYYPPQLYFNTIDDLYNAVPNTNLLFSLSYQNRSNKTILVNYCKLLRTICPDLNYSMNTSSIQTSSIQSSSTQSSSIENNSSHLDGYYPKSRNKIKICFFAEGLTCDSSVLRDRLGIITKLPRNKFDVYYMGFQKPEDIRGRLAKFVNQKMLKYYICLPDDDLLEARRIIEGHKFDILIYCEIGMRMRTMLLAYSRLAPIQINTWGHSETSGIDTIDYYISSSYFEMNPQQAQNNYSEKLICMNSLSTFYFQPSILQLEPNFKFQTREKMGLDPRINIYGCIQMSFKINRNYELMLKHILDKDPNGCIMMSTYKPFCKSQIDRIIETFGNNINRLIFYPALSLDIYLNLVKISDVVLDPYPFGGCNTTYEAFEFDVPVVTAPTKYINGRFTFGLYKKMGFVDLVAESAVSYVNLAVKCATDKMFRKEMSQKIKKNKSKIFQEYASVVEWSEVLEKLANKEYV